jgi:hypothetical protein
LIQYPKKKNQENPTNPKNRPSPIQEKPNRSVLPKGINEADNSASFFCPYFNCYTKLINNFIKRNNITSKAGTNIKLPVPASSVQAGVPVVTVIVLRGDLVFFTENQEDLTK